MKSPSLRFYEGNNIKRYKRVVKISITNSSKSQLIQYLKNYFRVCFLLGFKEKLISMEEGQTNILWVTYSQEEVARCILLNLATNNPDIEKTSEKASRLVCEGIINYLVINAEKFDIPYIKLADKLFQFGYGKNSVVVGNEYQSFQNYDKVIMTQNREILWQEFRYNSIPIIDGTVIYSLSELDNIKELSFPSIVKSVDKKFDVIMTAANRKELERLVINIIDTYSRIFICSSRADYRVICFKGKVGLVFRIEYDESNSKKSYEMINMNCEMDSIACKIYRSFGIEFMYMDIKEEQKLKVVDIGSVFDMDKVPKEIEDKIGDYLLMCFKYEGIGVIPIISITGTNGKTTTARLIYNTLSRLGINTGLTSTGGIFIAQTKVISGDTTGFLSARDVLKNNDVEVAVFETARGGILKNGLGYEKAKVAVITSLSEDHIGMQGIKSISDLLDIKSVVLEELADEGKIIVKAEESLVKAAFRELGCCFPSIYYRKDKVKKEICLFNIEKNKYIRDYIESGGEALYLEDNCIVYCKNGVERKILNVTDICFTHNGFSKGNILNLMCAIAAISKIVHNIEKVIEVLKDLKCDLYSNPGRQNILDIEYFKIILDYGHNKEAFEEVLSLGRSLNPSKITAIIAAPGDRMDSYIKELGSIAAKYSDYIIVREQDDLRGRKKDESASLIRSGILEESFNCENFTTIYGEEDALYYAMKNAQKGEIIVLFTQCIDVAMNAINKYLESKGNKRIYEDLDFTH